jgi:hypothetical protein
MTKVDLQVPQELASSIQMEHFLGDWFSKYDALHFGQNSFTDISQTVMRILSLRFVYYLALQVRSLLVQQLSTR